nr:unnamed protein product [Spirometra erinaceieuropaei]
MAYVSVADLKFRETLLGRFFQSLRDLEDAIKEFSQATGFYYKARNSHKHPLGSIHAEKFVYCYSDLFSSSFSSSSSFTSSSSYSSSSYSSSSSSFSSITTTTTVAISND